jgi:hypothetical protein
MAVLTLRQIEDLLRRMTLDITGLDGDNVRFAYPSKGQPAWDIDKNYVVITVAPANNPYDKFRDIKFKEFDNNNAEQEVAYTRVFSCLWTLYGPNAYDLADELRSGILLEENRRTLAVNDIFPLTQVPTPVRIPYDYNGQWWERVDIQAYYNVGTLRTSKIPYLKSADISIYTEDGLARLIEVEET